MAKFIDAVKVISAGCITEISGCRIIQKGDNTQARAAKKQCSTLGRKLTNHRTMQRTLYFLMAANFKPTDFFLTLTFDDTHLPRTRKEVMKAVEKFVKLLRKHRATRGQELLYIYCIESKHREGRYHVHMLVNATGQDVEALCSLWGGGINVYWQSHKPTVNSWTISNFGTNLAASGSLVFTINAGNVWAGRTAQGFTMVKRV